MKIISTFFLFFLTLNNTRASSSSGIRASSNEEFDPIKCPVFTRNPFEDDDLASKMIDAVKPCGTYWSRGCHHDVIRAGIDYPGEGPGELGYQPYIVQFDVGVRDSIKTIVVDYNKGRDCNSDIRECREALDLTDIEGNNVKGETCLEIIVKGGSDANGGCAGKCGSGCLGAGYAKDCMKHDICTTYKSLLQKRDNGVDYFHDDGFCRDIDCGDEAAQTLMNCYIDILGPWNKDITCEQHNFSNKYAYGQWSLATMGFSEGPCNHFNAWSNGQGIPDQNRISNPYEFLAYLESKGIDVSNGYEEDRQSGKDENDFSRSE